MARHIHETTEVGLVCLLKQGKPAGSSVTFVVLHDKVEKTRLDGAVVADARARAGKAATVKYKTPEVPDDKASYVITYKALADGEEYLGGDEIHVWPRKGKLTSRNEDDTQPLPGFKFKVVQNGSAGTDIFKAEGDPAVSDFRLAAGAPFTLEGVAPYAIVSDPANPAPQGGKLRDLKSKNKITFKAEFVDPKRPDSGTIKQWVNLDATAKKGTDALGTEVEITVGAEGDRDGSGTTVPEPLGRAGVFVYVKVKFSGPDNRKSKRNAPKTDLVAGLNLLDRVAVKEAATDAQWEYKGKVDLALAGGVGKFKLALGVAGGDSCEVSIGNTVACSDATLTFVNWRKIWYELMAPDVMALRDASAEDGTAVRDFPSAISNAMKTAGDLTFIDYAIHRSQSFTQDEATTTAPGSILKREFFQRNDGAAKCYLLTDYSFKTYPKAFDKSKGARGSLIKACDVNLFNDGPGRDADFVRRLDATTVQADYDLAANDPNILWSPSSAFSGGGGAASIRSLTWAAKIANPANYRGPPTYSAVAAVDDPAAMVGDDAQFTIDELTQNPAPCRVLFRKPWIGNTATDLDDAAKAAIDLWLAPLWTDAKVRPNDFKLQFRFTGQLGNERRQARVTSLDTYIRAKLASAPPIYKHAGLKPDGSVRSGNFVVADVVDMDRSHWKLIAVNLPAADAGDPGSFVGPLDATAHCPVSVTFTFEPQHSGLGMAGQGAQKGELLLLLDTRAPLSVSDIALHELGHQYNLSNVAHGLPGIANAKGITENEPEARYRDVGTKGNFYTGMGHSGGHCAFGLTDADKTRANFHGLRGKCIMYGASSMNDGTRTATGFCPQCADHARARDLSALK